MRTRRDALWFTGRAVPGRLLVECTVGRAERAACLTSPCGCQHADGRGVFVCADVVRGAGGARVVVEIVRHGADGRACVDRGRTRGEVVVPAADEARAREAVDEE